MKKKKHVRVEHVKKDQGRRSHLSHDESTSQKKEWEQKSIPHFEEIPVAVFRSDDGGLTSSSPRRDIRHRDIETQRQRFQKRPHAERGS